MSPPPPELSIVVPLFNEEENLPHLRARLLEELEALGKPFEVILVDDGSRDATGELAEAYHRADARFQFVRLRRNAGQTAALMAGFEAARGGVLVPMDGDLQNDPADIHRLLEKLEEGYDVVSGWRKDRKDAALRRNLPSRVANSLISWISGVHIHDYGCTLKVYRRDVLEGVKLYGEMHRFIPIYASWMGARVTELPVTHHPRTRGVSKYGLERVFKVVLDLIVVTFLGSHLTKPIYLFGGLGLGSVALSFSIVLLVILLRLIWGVYMIQTPLLLLAVMLFITGVMMVLMGILAELQVRTYFESQDKPVYRVAASSLPRRRAERRGRDED